MGRRPKYDKAAIEGAALKLIAERGVRGATIAAIAAEVA